MSIIYGSIQEQIKNRNGVRIIDKDLKKEMEVQRKGDKIMLINIVLGEETNYIIYANTQIG